MSERQTLQFSAGIRMLRTMPGLTLVVAVLVASFGPAMAAPAADARVSQNHSDRHSQDLAARTKRPRVTIYPRRFRPGPNAIRQCRSWLVREYRVSGPVIVPRMRCWWE